ncbi:nicotinate-nucleotide--dimethylbenzimidazole phosphoribosyltransferase [Lamprobacter modestohalophilus]|uniref:nicotinate-nucleotide--dimethylbenzimidazole phosphoribosyltransferase n=1 Tax=Lamprobacter modestohalophilus TaxID=1064514 RepID=UPI003D18F5D2
MTKAKQWRWAGNSSCPGFSANDDLEIAAGRELRAEDQGDWVSEVRIDLGRHDPAAAGPSVQRFDLGPGTADSRLDAAMDGHQLDLALSAGRHAVERAKLDGIALIWAQGQGAGAATTNQAWRQRLMPATTACACDSRQFCGDAFLMPDALELAPFAQPEVVHTQVVHTQCRWCEGVDEDACRLLRRHAATLADPYSALRCLGGFEHAALVGSALAAAQLGLAWRALGASACIALLLALRLNPSVRPWLHPASVLTGCGRDYRSCAP